MTADRPSIVCIPNGEFQENCYLIADSASGDAVIVDPGEETDRFLAEAKARGWTIGAIWLTHAHVDHIMGVDAVKRATGAPIYLHPADRPLYDRLPMQSIWVGRSIPAPPPPDVELADGDRLTVGPHTFEVRHVPGHSPGSVALVGHGVVLGGDVLFRESVGRVDLPGGDGATLLASIKRSFLSLPDDTVVYSGHGLETTIGHERRANPFLTGAVSLV